jgi:hypothetical protein
MPKVGIRGPALSEYELQRLERIKVSGGGEEEER